MSARLTILEDRLAFQIKAFGLPEPEREYRFHPERKWRFDFAWPAYMLAAEIEGLVPTWKTPGGGRHQRIGGYEDDLVKYNAAAALGWKVLRFGRSHVLSVYAIRTLEDSIKRGAIAGEYIKTMRELGASDEAIQNARAGTARAKIGTGEM